MRKYIFAYLLFGLFASTVAYSQVDQSEEVQVIEHLGDTIPLDLQFVTDKMDTVTLRELIL